MTQKRWLILAGSWVVVFVGFYLFVWRPNISDIRQTQRKIRAAEVQLNQLMRDVATWPATATRDKMENYEKRLEHLFSLVPLAEEVSQLLEQIEEEGIQQAELKLVSLEHELVENAPSAVPTSGTSTQEVAKLQNKKETYKLIVEGDYEALVQFLYQLENAPRLINVHTLSIKRVVESDMVQVTLTLDIFHTGSSS